MSGVLESAAKLETALEIERAKAGERKGPPLKFLKDGTTLTILPR